MKKNTIITALLAIFMLFSLVGCGSQNGEPVAYDAPNDAPYKGLVVVDRMNSSSSYEYSKGSNKFSVTMNWATKNENIDSATFSDHYYLEYSSQEQAFYELCEPVNDMSKLKDNINTIKPGEKVTINFDVDSYFDGLPKGYYRFVKVLDVKYKDGSTKQELASFSFDLNN